MEYIPYTKGVGQKLSTALYKINIVFYLYTMLKK